MNKEILNYWLKCPYCGSDRLTKSGTKEINKAGDKKQQYRCKDCKVRTIRPINPIWGG